MKPCGAKMRKPDLFDPCVCFKKKGHKGDHVCGVLLNGKPCGRKWARKKSNGTCEVKR